MARQVNSGDPSSGYPSKINFDQTGSIADADLTIFSATDKTKQIVFNASAQTTGKTITLAAGANSADITLTLPTSSGTLATTAGNFTNPMTTGGDVIYGGALGVGARLANGSATQLLTSSGGTAAPTWTGPCVAVYKITTGSGIDGSTPVNYETSVIDTHSAVTTGAGWKFTAPITGYYSVYTQVNYTGGGAWTMQINKNGSLYLNGAVAVAAVNKNFGGFIMQMTAGDYFQIFSDQTRTTDGSNYSHIHIMQVR